MSKSKEKYTKDEMKQLTKAYETITGILAKGLTEIQANNLIHSGNRIAKAMAEITSYTPERMDEILSKSFEVTERGTYNNLIMQKDISSVSICPHHLLPITYKVSFAVANPLDRVLGLSKYVRLIKELAKQPILQEEYTDLIVEKLNTVYSNVYVEVCGQHGCMLCRGVQSEVHTITTASTKDFNPGLHNFGK